MGFDGIPGGWKVSIFLLAGLLSLQAFVGSSVVALGLIRPHGRRPGFAANQPVCNIFMGSWVRDDSYPLYQSLDCPIIDAEFNCQLYGRPDTDYLRYRWKPSGCDLPRFAYIYIYIYKFFFPHYICSMHQILI